MKKKSVNLVFLFLLLAVGCSQETVMNGSISGKTNASDTKMSINIVTETSRTVRPAVTKWEIKVTNEEENNLEYSKTVDSKTTSVTFINIVATATYTVEVHGLDEDENKILSGAKEKVQVEANKVNICNVTVSDDFNTDKSDKNGTLSVNINGLATLGIQENSNFTLEMSGLTKSDENKDVTLSYKDGVLSGLESDILPGSYKISIADFPVNVIQDPIVNIYPGAVTTIDWTWNYNDEESQKQVGDNIKQKNTLIPVWNKNADGGDSVGLIGANGLFVTPTWENGTFVACDVDTAGDMWTLTITETAITEDNNQINTYKLTNEHTEESYYFMSVNPIEDFAIATLNLDEYLDNSSHEDNEKAAIKEYFKKTEINYLLLLVNGNNEKYIDSCFIKKLPTTKHDTLPAVPSTSYTSCENEEFYCITVQSGLSIILSTITAIEVFGKDLYIASRNGTNYLIDDRTIFDRHSNVFANIYKAEISIRGIKIETFEDSTIQISNESALFPKSVTEMDGYYHTPILTLDIGEYFEVVVANFSSGSPDFIKTFLNDAFKISDMYVKGETLYITAGCVNYNSSE
ncbi:MAG: hypothetical protein UHW86_09040, partial [Spirochaetota bacterium]|nr:hypothetical protein [Spirochaetota bacterium]